MAQEKEQYIKEQKPPIISWARMEKIGQTANISDISALQRAVKLLHELVN